MQLRLHKGSCYRKESQFIESNLRPGQKSMIE